MEGFWNGLPTQVRRVTGVVRQWTEGDPEYAWWAGRDYPGEMPEGFKAQPAEDLQGQRIEAVEVVLDGVNYGGGIAYLDNRDGSGWYKVTEGHGSPRLGHRDVPLIDIEPSKAQIE